MINVQKQTMIDFGVQKTLFTKENGKTAEVSIVLNIFYRYTWDINHLFKLRAGLVYNTVFIF